MRDGSWAIFGVVCLALFALGAGAVYVVFGSKSSTTVPKVATSEKVETVSHLVIGHSLENRTIDAYTYGSGEDRLMFVGGMHGGYEWNSVLLAYEAMDYFRAHPDALPKNLSVTVIPVLNPDGLYKILGKEGRFTLDDVPKSVDQSPGRFNAHGVDLNRNFDCKWQPKSTWRSKEVSAGTAPFSEPESAALRDYVLKVQPKAVVYWHSQANAVYASECEHGILPGTLEIMQAYADSAGYPAVKVFDGYKVTGDTEGWLASIGIPAITVELSTHETTEWNKNQKGIQALIDLLSTNHSGATK